MLATGSERLERMRDGRVIFIGAERVDDVTTHPAFRNGARTIAALYDLKANPAKRDLFTYEEDGERIGLPWLRCRTREDLARRMRAIAKRWMRGDIVDPFGADIDHASVAHALKPFAAGGEHGGVLSLNHVVPAAGHAVITDGR